MVLGFTFFFASISLGSLLICFITSFTQGNKKSEARKKKIIKKGFNIYLNSRKHKKLFSSTEDGLNGFGNGQRNVRKLYKGFWNLNYSTTLRFFVVRSFSLVYRAFGNSPCVCEIFGSNFTSIIWRRLKVSDELT